MKVLVTGATGFIGGAYVKHLCSKHSGVQVTFSGRDREKGNALAAASGAHFFRGELTDDAYLNLICKEVDIIVHSAGMTGVWGEYDEYYQANVVATEKLIAAALDTGVRRIINMGTPSIYFDMNDHLNVTEDFLPARFHDNYARTKYQAESRILRAHSEQMKTLSLRPRFVIGPGDVAIFPRMLEMHRAGKLVQVGAGRNVVSMTCISNLMQALDCAVFGPDDVTGEAYNIADGKPVNLWQTLNQLMDALELPPVSKKVPYSLAYGIAAVNEGLASLLRKEREPTLMRVKTAVLAQSFTLNIEKARHRLGYQPKDRLLETIDDFVQWYKNSAH